MNTKRLAGLLIMLSVALTTFAAVGYDSVSILKAKADSLFNKEQYSQALEAYIIAMDAAERAADQPMRIAVIGNIANIYAISGEYERSEHYINMGYEAATSQHDSDLVGKFLINSVGVYCAMNNVEKARQQLQLMNSHPLTDNTMWSFYTIHYAGVVARLEGNLEAARSLAGQALDYALDHDMGLRYELVQYSELGNISLMEQESQQALAWFKQHLHKAEAADSRELYASSCHMLADAYRQAGYEDSASFYLGIYNTLRDSVIDQRQLAAAKEKLYQYENRLTAGQISSLNNQLTRLWWLLAVVVAVSLLAVGFFWLRGHRRVAASKAATLDTQQPPLADTTPVGPATADNRSPIHLNDDQVRQLASQINDVMCDAAVICRADFSLQQLATLVSSNTKYVSYAINEVYGKTFKTLLNEKRIDEAARRLQDVENYGNITIQGIYLEVGYNSAAAFIQAFKRIKGMTPSQFQRTMTAAAQTAES